MRGVVTEHTLIVKAIVALVVCSMQSPAFSARFTRLTATAGSAP
jgi:simple sugar transport system permease protein